MFPKRPVFAETTSGRFCSKLICKESDRFDILEFIFNTN